MKKYNYDFLKINANFKLSFVDALLIRRKI